MNKRILSVILTMVAFGALADSTWYSGKSGANYSDNYGIRGRCDGTWRLFDFASDGNLAYVPVKVVIDPQNHTEDYTFPLFTVGAAEAETLAVKAKRVNAAYEPVRGFSVQIGKTANDDGSVTFTATVCTTGLAAIVR